MCEICRIIHPAHLKCAADIFDESGQKGIEDKVKKEKESRKKIVVKGNINIVDWRSKDHSALHVTATTMSQPGHRVHRPRTNDMVA